MRRPLLLAAVVLAASTGCSVVASTEGYAAGPAGECVLNSDCEGDRVCIFAVCSVRCKADEDCTDGTACLKTESVIACVRPEDTQCGDDVECPGGTTCVAGGCRTDCEARGLACAQGQRCLEGSCEFGRLLEAGSLTSGTGRRDGGGNPGAGETPQPEGGSGAEPDSGTGLAQGDPCDNPGLRICAGTATSDRQVCKGGHWEPTEPCLDGRLCDSSSEDARCAPVVSECQGRKPGESYCVGADRITCGQDLVDSTLTECASAAHCSAGTGSACAVCLATEHTCDGSQLQRCRDDRQGFEDVGDPCERTDLCNTVTASCSTDACNDGQRVCDDDRLMECNDARDGFVEVRDCGQGLCDPEQRRCNACLPNQDTCENGQRSSCSSDGQRETLSDCPEARPFCVGAGVCVQCQQDTDCSAGPCQIARCNVGSGMCELTNVARGTRCAGGYCDGAGSCADCTLDTHCAPQDDCHTASCVVGSCTQSPVAQHTACDGGYCDAAGVCQSCTRNTHCTPQDSCHTARCASGECEQTQKAEHESCNGGYCDAAGRCRECTRVSQCPDEGDCTQATCNSYSCGVSNLAAATTCGYLGSNDGVCDGAGQCGECVPGRRSCATNRLPRECSADGLWVNEAQCSGTTLGCEGGDCVNTCRDGTLDPWEDADSESFGDLSLDATCTWDFSNVVYMYCASLCSPGAQNCGQDDADLLCRLRMRNPGSVAISWANLTAPSAPGLACGNRVSPPVGSRLRSFPEWGVDTEIWFDNDLRASHGAGGAIVVTQCSNP